MVVDVIGDLLPSAVGVALSPVPIVAIILVLATPRARATGGAFALGWVLGLAVVGGLVTLAASGASDEGQPSTLVGWVKLAIGCLFLALAGKQWRSRPRPGNDVEPPRWMAAVDAMAAGRAGMLGAALAGLNPKNLALIVAAAATIGDAEMAGAEAFWALALFVLLGSVSVAGPTIWYLVAPTRAQGPLNGIKDFMLAHNTVIMMTVLLILGAKLVGNGLALVAN